MMDQLPANRPSAQMILEQNHQSQASVFLTLNDEIKKLTEQIRIAQQNRPIN